MHWSLEVVGLQKGNGAWFQFAACRAKTTPVRRSARWTGEPGHAKYVAAAAAAAQGFAFLDHTVEEAG